MNFNWEITKQVLGAIVRYILASLGTFLVTKGIVDPALANAFLNEATAIVVGIVILLVTIGWKYLNAKFNILALIKAVQTDPPADTPREVQAAVDAVKADVKAENTVTTV